MNYRRWPRAPVGVAFGTATVLCLAAVTGRAATHSPGAADVQRVSYQLHMVFFSHEAGLSQNYGIDKICDYAAEIEVSTKLMDNPARKNANAAVREAEKNLAAAERDLAALLGDPAITPAAKNSKLIPAAEKKIAAARRQPDAAKKARAPIPASEIGPQAQVALLRTGGRGLQMVLRLLAHNAGH